MNRPEVHSLDPLSDRRWRECVDAHPRASIFHTPQWLEALHRTYGYEPIAYTTSAPNENLTGGVVFGAVKSWLTGRRLVSVPFADHCEPLVDTPQDGAAVFDELGRIATHGNWKYIELRPVTVGLVDETRHVCGAARSYCFHTLDLRRSAEELFRSLHRTAMQQPIRRAERSGLEYRDASSDEALEQFYRLLILTRRRHRLPPQPREWFRNLIACFGNRLSVRMTIRNGQALAAMVLLRHSDKLVYKYGVSDAATHALGTMPFLFWKTILDAKANG